MSKYAFRVRVYVNSDTLQTDASLGLLNNVFSWVAGGNVAVADTSEGKHGILAKDFIDSIKKSVNVKRTGDIANIDGFSLKLDNTQQFWSQFITIFGNNVSLHGSKVTIEELTYNGATYDGALLYAGFCDLPSFDKATMVLPVRGDGDVRRSKLGVLITANDSTFETIDESSISKIYPLTFGEVENAKFLAYNDSENRIDSGQNIIPQGLTTYPVWEGDGVVNTTLLAVMGEAYGVVGNDADFIGQFSSSIQNGTLYIKITKGNGEGQIRKVSGSPSLYGWLPNDGEVDNVNMVYSFDIINPWSYDVFGLEDTNTGSDELTWVEFYDIRNSYVTDNWNNGLESMLNADMEATTYNYPIRIFDKDFEDIGEFTLGGSNSDNNTITLDPNQYDEDPNKIVTYKISQDAPLRENTDDRYLPSGFTYDSINHIWYDTSITANSVTFDQGNTQTDDTITPYDLSLNLDLTGLTNQSFIHSMLLDIPTSVPNTFTNAYLVMNLSQAFESPQPHYGLTLTMTIKKQNWKGDPEDIYTTAYTRQYTKDDVYLSFVNFPTLYTTAGLNSQVPFWDLETIYPLTATTETKGEYGYLKIPMDFASFADMGSNKHIVIELKWTFSTTEVVTAYDLGVNIPNAGFVFEQPKDVDKDIYSNVSGRKWGQNFDSSLGWLATEPIRDPVGMIAHIKALQDFSNEGVTTPSLGWGKDYTIAQGSYINKSGDTTGSFAHQDLQSYRNVRIGHQTTKESASDSKSMVKKLCNQFFLISWVNANGQECLAQLASKSAITPTTTIDQSKMLAWGKRTEMDSRDIFVEPFISFKKNYANDKYLQTAKITNTASNLNTDEEKLSAVLGLDDISDGERIELWEKARALYEYYGVINEAPKMLTNNDYITSQEDAKFFLDEWLTFQGVSMVNGVAVVTPRNFFSFTIPYEEGRLLDIGDRLLVNVPNITDSLDYEALIYGISKDIAKEMPEVKINVVLYDLAVADPDGWLDSYDDTLGTTTQDTIDDTQDTIQDEV